MQQLGEVAVLDIETNLNHDTIWMVGLYLPLSGKSIVCTNRDELSDALSEIDTVIGHNLTGFDLHVLEKVWGYVYFGRVLDTLVMSRLYCPDIEGGHSLEACAERAGRDLKSSFDKEDFDKGLTDEMIKYCLDDCRATWSVFQDLRNKLQSEKFSQESIDLEHDVAFIIAQQIRNGVCFDFDKACEIYTLQQKRMEEISSQLQELFPPIVTERWSEKTGCRLKDHVEVFNVGSRQQIAKRLELLGAKWEETTPKGKPKVDEKTLKANDHIPEAALIAEYLTLQKHSGMVSSWIDACKDGRIHGFVNPNGAVTGRMTHSKPNLGQVPSGSEFRKLFKAPEGRVMVGIDASGLELRCLAHYMKDENYVNELLNGDVHTANQRAAGLPTRDKAKTFIYAFLYGAGDAKIGSIVGGSKRDGAKLKRQFLNNLPALKELIQLVKRLAAKGTLPGLDGRRLRVRSEHKVLNTLLQGMGAIVMKKALVLAMSRVDTHKCSLVLSVHDEYQFECDPEYADTLGSILVESIREAGNVLNCRCPLDGEYKVGENWSETH